MILCTARFLCIIYAEIRVNPVFSLHHINYFWLMFVPVWKKNSNGSQHISKNKVCSEFHERKACMCTELFYEPSGKGTFEVRIYSFLYFFSLIHISKLSYANLSSTCCTALLSDADYRETTHLPDGGQDIGFAFIIPVCSHSQIDLVWICVKLESFGDSKDWVRGTKLHIWPPGTVQGITTNVHSFWVPNSVAQFANGNLCSQRYCSSRL